MTYFLDEPFLMTSFLDLSFRETPSINHSILISVLSSNPSSLLAAVQASAPYMYISTGLIIVYLSCIPFPFRIFDILSSHKAPSGGSRILCLGGLMGRVFLFGGA